MNVLLYVCVTILHKGPALFFQYFRLAYKHCAVQRRLQYQYLC